MTTEQRSFEDYHEEDVPSLFQTAATRAKDLGSNVSQADQLQLYALYKQATVGQCNVARPALWDFTGRAKWNAWNNLGAMNEHDAMVVYIRKFIDLGGSLEDGGRSNDESESPSSSSSPSSAESSTSSSPSSQGSSRGLMGPVVSTMMEGSADAEDTETMTVFDLCQYGYVDRVEKYLDGGGALDVEDDQGLTLLHWACDGGHPKLTKLLLSKGAFVDAQDHEGQTPLHYAITSNQLECAKLLLAANARVDIEDAEAETPYDLAELEGKELLDSHIQQQRLTGDQATE